MQSFFMTYVNQIFEEHSTGEEESIDGNEEEILNKAFGKYLTKSDLQERSVYGKSFRDNQILSWENVKTTKKGES